MIYFSLGKFFSPQQSGVADVIFPHSFNESKMEVYKTSRLEKRREKAKQPSFDLFKKTIEKIQACSNDHVTIQSTLIMGSQSNNRFGKMICGKWFSAIRGSQL